MVVWDLIKMADFYSSDVILLWEQVCAMEFCQPSRDGPHVVKLTWYYSPFDDQNMTLCDINETPFWDNSREVT